MQAILCQNSSIPQKDNFGIGVQVSVLSHVCGEWIQMVDSVTFWSMQMLELSYSRHCGFNS